MCVYLVFHCQTSPKVLFCLSSLLHGASKPPYFVHLQSPWLLQLSRLAINPKNLKSKISDLPDQGPFFPGFPFAVQKHTVGLIGNSKWSVSANVLLSPLGPSLATHNPNLRPKRGGRGRLQHPRDPQCRRSSNRKWMMDE